LAVLAAGISYFIIQLLAEKDRTMQQIKRLNEKNNIRQFSHFLHNLKKKLKNGVSSSEVLGLFCGFCLIM
jgi:tetrahydromethanopterin S-methyltransferase subunit F